MPVGLNLLETVESKLLDTGLLPRDGSVLHRVIDFSKGEFTLRWNSAETDHHTITVHLVQQLAQRKGERPMMIWSVMSDESDSLSKSGRILLSSSLQPTNLADAVATACRELLGSTASPESTAETPASVPQVDESLLSGPSD